MRRIISKILLMAGLTTALSSCNGIMGGLYDEPQNEETPTYGFLKKSDGTHAGRIYVDATKYDRWVFLGWFVPTKLVKDEFTNWGTVSTLLFPVFLFLVRFVCPVAILCIFMHQFGVI